MKAALCCGVIGECVQMTPAPGTQVEEADEREGRKIED